MVPGGDLDKSLKGAGSGGAISSRGDGGLGSGTRGPKSGEIGTGTGTRVSGPGDTGKVGGDKKVKTIKSRTKVRGFDSGVDTCIKGLASKWRFPRPSPCRSS